MIAILLHFRTMTGLKSVTSRWPTSSRLRAVGLRFGLARCYLSEILRGIRQDDASLVVHTLAGIDLT